MFQAKDSLNVAPSNENDNRKKKFKKTHISRKRNLRSKPRHSNHKKRLDLNINNPYLKHAKYTSDYISAERLTKNLLGFLGKGKISESISRIEKVMPENYKARSKKDLNRILSISSADEVCSYNQDCLPQTSGSFSSSQNGNNSSSSSPVFHRTVLKKTSINSKKRKCYFDAHLSADNSVISSTNSPSLFCKNNDDTVFCREVITKSLHCAISETNKAMFPGISNQNLLIKELFDLKNQYHSFKKALPSSNNYESSQDIKNTGSFESPEKQNFKLNPVLTQESPVAKGIESMFPDSQNLSFDNDSMSDDSVSLITNHAGTLLDHDDSKLSITSSGKEGSMTLIPSSPISSSGSPVWVPELSRIKFVPDFLPTPKLFYRQKMF